MPPYSLLQPLSLGEQHLSLPEHIDDLLGHELLLLLLLHVLPPSNLVQSVTQHLDLFSGGGPVRYAPAFFAAGCCTPTVTALFGTSINIASPARNSAAACTYIPLAIDPVRPIRYPITIGLKKLPSAASDEISASPPAAAAGPRYRAGIAQNVGIEALMPIDIMVITTSDQNSDLLNCGATTSASAVTMAHIAKCHRRSACRSELRVMNRSPTAAAANGIIPKYPTFASDLTPRFLMIVGSQKFKTIAPPWQEMIRNASR